MERKSLIQTAREAAGFTQQQLAEALGVSTEAVSKWEQGKYQPAPENREKLEAVLHLSYYDEKGEPRNARLFNEEHMSAFLKGRLNAGDFPQAGKALDLAKKQHKGQVRKGPGSIPYISHPLTMACHAFAMGLEDDTLLAALLLHDTAEDCGVKPEELPVSEEARRIVALVTKPESGYSPEDYFRRIAENPKACLVKCIDRCSNLSTMALGFTKEKMAAYIRETEKYYPELLKIVKAVPEYNNAAWLLQYQMKSLLETAKKIG